MRNNLNNSIFLIGEIGVNHNGDMQNVFRLTDVIKKAGADYAKIQSFIPNELCAISGKLAPYQKKSGLIIHTQLNLLKKYQLSFEQQKKFFNYCNKIKIKPLASIFDFKSANFLVKNKIRTVKIPSGEITNLPLLEYVAKNFKKIIISTGVSDFNEINDAINIFLKRGIFGKNLILMQCNSSYPSRLEDANLNVLKNFEKKFQVTLGYSDHTKDNLTSIISLGAGAKYFEKHVTISKKMIGPDHKASLSPKEFKEYCKVLKQGNIALGSHNKFCTPSEKENKIYIRKSIYAKLDIKKGEKFSHQNLSLKRPAIGIEPKNYFYLLGKKSKKNYKENSLIAKVELI